LLNIINQQFKEFKPMKNFVKTGVIALVVLSFSACGGPAKTGVKDSTSIKVDSNVSAKVDSTTKDTIKKDSVTTTKTTTIKKDSSKK
jgi:hypothetical protein